MPQFDISSFSSQLFWLVMVFGVMYFVISRFIVPKAESILTARNRYITENITYAEDYKKEAEKLSTAKQEKLIEINTRVQEIQKKAIELLESRFMTQKADLSSTLDIKEKAALDEIQEYIDKFHADEPIACINLAGFIIEKITGKPADVELLKKIHLRA
jgi:F-type H+-transporting ATPase subunit b